MLTKFFSTIIALAALLLLTNCDPVTYITKQHYFSEKYLVEELHTPSYPFLSDKKNANPISIAFPKHGEYTLYLSENQCNGAYEANTDGKLTFTRSNCSASCCETEWDLYLLTLIKKTTRFEGGEDEPLILFIDDQNFITLKELHSH
ncbi:hypothetical protein [Carboxylicivirga taeanensis]|uniref:hypothetical protein n=1 Tax=Carboxylicivirga taeanensis TaxID=1416875 RepID=UPI003F6DE87B